jgi:hypothetical protein
MIAQHITILGASSHYALVGRVPHRDSDSRQIVSIFVQTAGVQEQLRAGPYSYHYSASYDVGAAAFTFTDKTNSAGAGVPAEFFRRVMSCGRDGLTFTFHFISSITFLFLTVLSFHSLGCLVGIGRVIERSIKWDAVLGNATILDLTT